MFRTVLDDAVTKPGKTWRNVGDADAQLASASRRLDSIYATPHLGHLTMEPPSATAHVTKDGCEVWAATQNPQEARSGIAKALGIAEGKVNVHVTLLGGGFGRKSKARLLHRGGADLEGDERAGAAAVDARR